jgi:hypothetical protein
MDMFGGAAMGRKGDSSQGGTREQPGRRRAARGGAARRGAARAVDCAARRQPPLRDGERVSSRRARARGRGIRLFVAN